MKKYILTSAAFKGKVEFGYNASGAMAYFLNDSDLEMKGQVWLLQHLPVHQDHLQKLSKQIKGGIVEVPQNIEFEAFWNAGLEKHNKIRVLPIWEKLSQADRLLAVMQVAPYKAYLKRTGYRNPVGADRYLKERYFDTEWAKMTK